MNFVLITSSPVLEKFYKETLQDIRVMYFDHYQNLDHFKKNWLPVSFHKPNVAIVATAPMERRETCAYLLKTGFHVYCEALFDHDYRIISTLAMKNKRFLRIVETRFFTPEIDRLVTSWGFRPGATINIISRYNHTNLFEHVHQDVQLIVRMMDQNLIPNHVSTILRTEKRSNRLNDYSSVVITIQCNFDTIFILICEEIPQQQVDYRIDILQNESAFYLDNHIPSREVDLSIPTPTKYQDRFGCGASSSFKHFVSCCYHNIFDGLSENNFNQKVNFIMQKVEHSLRKN